MEKRYDVVGGRAAGIAVDGVCGKAAARMLVRARILLLADQAEGGSARKTRRSPMPWAAGG
jgi:hypothetical protein